MPKEENVLLRQRHQAKVEEPSVTGSTGTDSVSASDSASASTSSAAVKLDDAAAEREKKKQAFVTRTIWTVVMITFFLSVIAGGHTPLVATVFLFQTLTFREIIALTSEPARDKNIPYNKSLNWYFLLALVYYLDGQSFILFFEEQVYSNKLLSILAIHHKFISYALFIAGFIFFVWTLKKGFYKFQFAQLCITHMTLILVVFQAHLIMENILNGIIWFVLPAALVIVNDIFAYLCGITFGRTQLIEISPKKTVEGFVGAWIFTGILALLFAFFIAKSNFFICPAENLSTSIFNFPDCDPNPVFIPQYYTVPKDLVEYLQIEYVIFKPIYFHASMLATFASLIAPFGGFFASGLKRAFGIKDFGDTIPGHGGITDRMDCQFLMGSFSYLYYQTFISTHSVNVGTVLQMAVINLSMPQLIQLIKSLLKYLNNAGAIEDKVYLKIIELLS